MLEIIIVVVLCKSLGNQLRAKGRKPFWMQFLLVVAWFGGEFAGGVVGGIAHVIQNGPDAPMGMGVYLFAIVGAALGAGFTFLIASLLPASDPETPPAPYGDDPFERRTDPNNPYAP